MQVLRGLSAQADRGCVLTIGNFDGVHRGHQALLRRLMEDARARGLPARVLTFEPHPREFFAPPEQRPPRLSSLREKLLLLASCGVDAVHVCRFNAAFAALSAREFVRLVVDALHPVHVLIGDDFRFGRNRAGNLAFLAQAGQVANFTVTPMHSVTDDNGARFSSSAIRAALQKGELDIAAHHLGRPYTIAGRVSQGRRLGRTLGFATANILLRYDVPALSGVFAVRVEGLGERLFDAVANLGWRPTVQEFSRPCLETHLFDWQGDCYGRRLRVHFLHRLRAEHKFASLDALKAQIARDAEDARQWLAAHPQV